MIESDSADAMAAIHIVEHFYEWEVPDILREWQRILKPGGKMILELPCLNKVLNYIAWCHVNRSDMLPFMSMWALWGDGKHHDPAMCHKYGWFQKTLMDLLTSIGMREVQSTTPRYHFQFRDMRIECLK